MTSVVGPTMKSLKNLGKATPSPGTPGGGGGEGDLERKKSWDTGEILCGCERTASRNHPHPNPLPEYREREK